jgi:hypothetical protein
LTPIIDDRDREVKCSTCGGNREVVSKQRFDEGYRAGVYYDIDLKTGRRAKKKKK